MKQAIEFPSPLEVDRFLYSNILNLFLINGCKFPSPSEVDRFLYVVGRHDIKDVTD